MPVSAGIGYLAIQFFGTSEKHSEREQLLGVTDNIQPRLRTPEEIMAKYRKAGVISCFSVNFYYPW